MIRFACISMLLVSSLYASAQVPEIVWASSDYRTSSGAIGPSGIVSTTTFALKIHSSKSLIMGRSQIERFEIDGDGMILPTNLEETMEFRFVVYCIQKNGTTYSGKLEFGEMWVPVEVRRLPGQYQPTDPAISLELRTSDSAHLIFKQEFDRKTSQYNK